MFQSLVRLLVLLLVPILAVPSRFLDSKCYCLANSNKLQFGDSKNMSAKNIDAHDRVKGYKPPLEFEEDVKKSLFDLTSSDSQEFWLIQWPASQPPDFDGQEVSLKLHPDGKLGSFEGSSGKVYDIVSFSAQEPDANVFLSSSRESKMVGKISRRVSFVHFPDPKELEKANSSNLKHKDKSSGFSITTSSHQFTTPTQSSGKSCADSVSQQTTSTRSSKQKSSLSKNGKPSNPAVSVYQSLKKLSKKRRHLEPTRSIGQSTQSSQRGSNAITMCGLE